MTYNEWRDELKSNLLCVSEAERRRVLDYYAEAYADRRDAGFTEREIIADFGAPYDAAKKILQENSDDGASNTFGSNNQQNHSQQNYNQNSGYNQGNTNSYNQNANGYNQGQQSYQYAPPPPPPPQKPADYTWVFVLLCIICAVPLFGVIMALIGITIGLICAPFGILVSGVTTIGAGIGMMFTEPLAGAATLGVGIMLFGVSLVLIPPFTKLVKLMWSLFKKLFLWIKGLFSGKGQTV